MRYLGNFGAIWRKDLWLQGIGSCMKPYADISGHMEGRQ